MNKLIVIVGPTASGKSELAVKLAKKLNGEIVSADSRQVYKGLDVGTAKPTKKERRGVPHYLIDVASPKRRFTVAQYQKQTTKAIASISRKGKVPFLVGGSPLYVYAVVDGMAFPQVKPNQKLRSNLNRLSIGQLYGKLKRLDPARAKTIEKKNKRRLIRALEIVLTTKEPVPRLKKRPLPYFILFLGIRRTRQELKNRIRKRFLEMLKRGFLAEIKKLRKQGLSWNRIESFGLEYREASQYIQGKLTRQEMIKKAIKATQDLACRQMTWLKKDPRIYWVQNAKEAEQKIKPHFEK